MSERLMEYRIMAHPSGDIGNPLKEQLTKIAKDVYSKETSNVIFRVKTVKKQANPRKLFIPGNGEVVEAEVLPHITLAQKIVINENEENKVLQKMTELMSGLKPFTLTSTELGDYGENFTIYLAFGSSGEANELVRLIEKEMKPFFSKEKEKRDLLHITLLYDDVSGDNINKAWKVISGDGLIDKQLLISSLWLWKNKGGWKPYKEFSLKKN